MAAVFDPNVFDSNVFDTGGPLLRDETIPIEWRATPGFVARDERIPIEWFQHLLRDERIPIEWQGPPGVVFPVFDRGVFDPSVFATGFQLERDEAIPIEWRGFQLLLREEQAIPIEWQVQPVLFFNWLAGGGGAPWPPEWLHRGRPLVSERGLGRLWWTGWSRTRWTPAPPLAPARLVPRLRPRRPRRTTALRLTQHREAGHAIAVWGGRSRDVFTPSPWPAIRRDDDELLLMLRLFRGL